MSDLTPLTSTLEISTLDVIVDRVVADLKRRGQTPELPTGLDALDEAIWGLHRSEVTILAAKPGEGKTTLALQIARHLADKGKKVAFISLEMTREQLCERLLIQLTQHEAWDLRVGKNIDAFLKKLEPLTPIFKKMNLRLIDGMGYTIEELHHLVAELVLRAGGAPDVLILDFIQLISVPGLPRFDAIAEYLKALKEVAMREKMAVLVCSQINRDATKRNKGRPTLSNLKGSGSLEELADCVILHWWQELGNEERPQGTRYWLLIEKNRHGPPGQQVPVRFDPAKLTFHGLDGAVAEWQDGGQDKASKDDTVEVEE